MKSYLLAILLASLISLPAMAATKAVIVYYKSGCDYFIAEDNSGFYLLQWYGGYYPNEGDFLIGEINTYGFKDVVYLPSRRNGTVWINDFLLSKNRVVEKYFDKCK